MVILNSPDKAAVDESSLESEQTKQLSDGRKCGIIDKNKVSRKDSLANRRFRMIPSGSAELV